MKYSSQIEKIQDFVKSTLASREEADSGTCEHQWPESQRLVSFFANSVLKNSWNLSVCIIHYYGKGDILEDISSALTYNEEKEIQENISSSTFEVVQSTRELLKKEWNLLHPKKKSSTKTRLVSRGAKAAKKALVRKLSRRLVSQTHTGVLALLEKHPKLQEFAPYLSTELGRAAVSMLLAMGLEFLPLPEAIQATLDPIKGLLVDELGTMALDEGTVPLENLTAMLLPALQTTLLPLLTSPEIKKLSA